MTTTKRFADAELVKDHLPHHRISTKQDSCLRCGKPRSSRARHVPQGSALHNLICSRRPCAEAKSLLRKASSVSAAADTVVVEVHHYYHAGHPAGEMHVAACVSELHTEPAQESWAELPGELFASHSAPQGHGRLPTILEEPPCVDVSSKPSADAVRAALSRRGW